MSPLVSAQSWVMVGGVLTRRGHSTITPDPWVYGAIAPDQPGMAGLPVGTVLTTAASGDVSLTNAGPSGPANLVFSGTGTLIDPYVIFRFRTTGIVYNRQTTTYTRFIECDVTYNAAGSSDGGIINSNQSGTGYYKDSVYFQQCDIHCLRPSIYLDGTYGHSMSTYRCRVWNVMDGFGWLMNSGVANNNANNWDYGSLIEKLVYFQGVDGNGPANSNPGGVTSPTQQRIDGTHNDGIQIQGGRGHNLRGTMIKCVYDGDITAGVTKMIRKNTNFPLTASDNGYPYYGSLYANGVIQINQNQGTSYPSGLITIDKAFMSGGHQQKINFSSSGYVEGTAMQFDDCSITNTTFYNDGGSTAGYYDGAKAGAADSVNITPSYPLVVPSGSNLWTRVATSGNQLEDGSPVPWRRGGSAIVGYSG